MAGFIAILSNIKINNYEQIELTESYLLRKANKNEISLIKQELSGINIIDGHFDKNPDFIYEYDVEAVKKDEITTSFIKKYLTEDKYRYWVIEFNDNGNKRKFLEKSIMLLKNSFEFGFIFITPSITLGNKETVVMTSDYTINMYKKISRNYPDYNAIEVDFEELELIPKLYEQLLLNGNKYNFINHAINNFDSLKYIDDNLDLLLVGYFSIIETLITHPPRLNESLDSISHQIVNKLNLLQKFFIRQLNYKEYFKEGKEETIWKKLYSYRSDIAHGNIVNFDNKYNILNSNKSIQLFLRETIKNLIILALEKPEFLNDLKKC